MILCGEPLRGAEVLLKTRIGKDGVLQVISQQTRSQLENTELAVKRFAELLRDALRQVPKEDASEQSGEGKAVG